MGKKVLALIFLSLIVNVAVIAQQTGVRYYDYNYVITNPDVFFDKKAYNPAYTGDTIKLRIDLKKMQNMDGYYYERDLFGLSVESYLEKFNSGIGIIYAYNLDVFKNHILQLNYNYRIKTKNNIRLRLATSIGLNHYALENITIGFDPEIRISSKDDWSNHPILSYGALVNIKNHEVGLSIYDLLGMDINPPDWSNPEIFKTFLISNYNYRFKVSEIVELKPEIILLWNPNVDFWIVNTYANFKNRFYTGLSYRSNDEISLMFAGRPWKKLKLGYTATYVLSDINIHGSYWFHGIQFSYMVF